MIKYFTIRVEVMVAVMMSNMRAAVVREEGLGLDFSNLKDRSQICSW